MRLFSEPFLPRTGQKVEPKAWDRLVFRNTRCKSKVRQPIALLLPVQGIDVIAWAIECSMFRGVGTYVYTTAFYAQSLRMQSLIETTYVCTHLERKLVSRDHSACVHP